VSILVLIDKKILAGGIAMLVVGMALLAIINSSVPVGKAGMTEEEIIELMIQEEENKNMNTLASILTGVGFLLVLISFGARKKSAGSAKKEEKKPVT
jgi:dolichol kinase